MQDVRLHFAHDKVHLRGTRSGANRGEKLFPPPPLVQTQLNPTGSTVAKEREGITTAVLYTNKPLGGTDVTGRDGAIFNNSIIKFGHAMENMSYERLASMRAG